MSSNGMKFAIIKSTYMPKKIFGNSLIAGYSASINEQFVESTGSGGTQVSDGAAVGWIRDNASTYHLTQSTTANKATYRVSHVNFNGRPVWDFDGGDYYQKAFGVTYNQPNAILAVAKFTNLSSNRILCDGDDVSHRHVVYNASTNIVLFADVALMKSGLDTNTNILIGIFNGASSKIYLNGGTPTTGNPGTQTMDGITFGALYDLSHNMLGQVAELVIIHGTPTLTQLNAIGAFWADYYGISFTSITA